MNNEREPKVSSRMQSALGQLREMISEQYPDTTFRVRRGNEDKGSIFLEARVDLDDPDEVMDLVVDRVLEFQLDQHLPIHVLPLRTPLRTQELLKQLRSKR